MDRKVAHDLLRSTLAKHGLDDWKCRLSTNDKFLGLCSHIDKTIYLNSFALDTHPDVEIQDTIFHEVAHALVGPGHAHDEIWENKAREIGCKVIGPCGMALSPVAIDAIRSGHVLEMEVIEKVSREVKYTVKKITEKCPVCLTKGVERIAEELNSYEFDGKKYITLKCLHLIIKDIPRGTPYELITFDGSSDCQHDWSLPFEVKYKVICSKCNAKRPYLFQLEGMRAIEKGLALNKGFAIFDEMGLGKTIQALGYIKYLPIEQLPVLFAVKSGLKYQFASEIIRVLGISYFPQIVKSSKDCLLPGMKTYIIGYDMLRSFDLSKFKKIGIKLVVLDECQLIKNVDTSRTKAVRELVRDIPNVLPLSGTPWKNHGDELFPVLNILDPKRFGSHMNFLSRWVDYIETPDGKFKKAGIRNIKVFRELTSDLLIRRESIEVMPEMPLVSRNKLTCEIPTEEQIAYDEELDKFADWFNNATIGGEEVNDGSIIGQLQRMRHIIGMAKIPFTVEWVKDFIDETDKKLIIGVHHIDVGNILAEFIEAYIKENELPIDVLRITSDMNSLARDTAAREFNSPNHRTIMVASTLSAGEGLNFQTASDVILHERQWNPQNEEQFECRVRRIGQKASKITANYIHARETVDEKLDIIVDNKRKWFSSVMNHEFTPFPANASFTEEMNQELQKKCKICKKTEEAHNVNWDGNSIMRELAESLVKERNKRRKIA